MAKKSFLIPQVIRLSTTMSLVYHYITKYTLIPHPIIYYSVSIAFVFRYQRFDKKCKNNPSFSFAFKSSGILSTSSVRNDVKLVLTLLGL